MRLTRLALLCGLPLVVACSIFGGDDDGSAASPGGSGDGETDAGAPSRGRDSGSATDGGRRGANDAGGGATGGTSACDELAYCCTDLDGSSQSSCEGVAASGDSLSCDGALASYRKQGLCAPGGGTDAGSGGGGAGGGFDAGSGGGGGTVTTCAELNACCATSTDPSTCALLVALGDDATCASYGTTLGCL